MTVLKKLVPSVLVGFFAVLLTTHTLQAASILDIGTQYRLRGVSVGRADYGLTSGENYSFYTQRALAHVGGRFSPNLEIMTQFQAIGVVGSSATAVNNPSVNPAGNRYPNTNFSPWLQWAYFKASQLHDWPIDITVGRQPITLGDGFLLSDDDLGFTGLRLQSRLGIWNLQADAFAFKVGENFRGSSDADIYGLELTKPYRNVRYQLSMITERDATGTQLYIRPQENASLSNPRLPTGVTPSNFNFYASRITRTFYDARIEGRLLQGGFYKAEFALQNGHVSRDSSLSTSSATTSGYSGDIDLSGYAFLISGGLFTRTSKYGPIEIHGTFGQASGDSGDEGKDSSFRPSFGHRFDGMERSGFGEFYGATLYDAFPSRSYNTTGSSPTVSGLPQGFSGIRVIGGGLTTHPTALLSIGVDYYVFDAMETAGASFPASSSDSSLGTELDIGMGFAYTNYLSFRASFALFSPGKAYPSQSQSRRFLIEATGRF